MISKYTITGFVCLLLIGVLATLNTGERDPHAQPNFNLTPGRLCTATDPDFKEYRYPEHIPYCRRRLTQQMKMYVAGQYGILEADWGEYEFDHLIPLGIGGASGVDNIWPQPKNYGDADEKDRLELELYRALSTGAITQSEAVSRTYDWFYSKIRIGGG
jgi:hypothetical protein